jgi:hypothetical protein
MEFMAELKRVKSTVDEEVKNNADISPKEIEDDEDWSDW